MQKIHVLILLCTISILTACGGSESGETSSPASAEAAGDSPLASADQTTEKTDVPALSNENKRLFYETMNIRTINYRKRLKALQESDGSLAKSPAVEATLALLSNSAFDEEAYQKAFTAYFDPFKSGKVSVASNLGQAFFLTCHSYLDKIVGNNTNGLSQAQMEVLQSFAEEMKAAALEPSEVLTSWNSAQLEEIVELPVVENIEKAFN